MKYIAFILAIALFHCEAKAQVNSSSQQTITIDGLERNYLLYLPDNLPPNAPLVMVFHGYSGTAAYANSYFNMEKLANENGFAVVYPEGTIDQVNNHFWQVGYKSHRELKVDDVSFVTQLASFLQEKYTLDESNTFIVGFSNGGDLCNKLICERPELFKAAAPIISCMMKEMYESCTNVAGKPIFMLNGTEDDITFWAGDMEDKQGYGPYHSTPTMLELRVEQNQAVLSSTETLTGNQDNDDTSITIEKYQGSNDHQVWMYQVNGGGHGHPDYLDLQTHVWDFFSLYLAK